MKILAYILVLVGFLNLVSYMVLTTANGGSAGHGKVQDGRYYVGNHSRYTEVSPLVFKVSLWQSNTIVITQLLMFAGGYYLSRQKKGHHAA